MLEARERRNIKFDYYYGRESQTFSFYRIPKALFTEPYFQGLSTDAKLLYGLMLDRMSLSVKNGWIDDSGRAYIIMTLEQVMEYMNCAKDKGVKLMAELDTEKGVGLIERVRQGFGRPALIYVKNFILVEQDRETIHALSGKPKSENKDSRSRQFGKSEVRSQENRSQEVGKTGFGGQKNRSQEVEKTEVRRSDFPHWDGQENRTAEFGKTDSNNTDNNKTENNNPSIIFDSVTVWQQVIKSNISYDVLMQECGVENQKYIDAIVDLMVEIMCAKRDTIGIAGGEYPYQLVVSRLMKIDDTHVRYVLECLQDNNKKIHQVKAYLLTCLFNAPVTMGSYYQNRVNIQGMREG